VQIIIGNKSNTGICKGLTNFGDCLKGFIYALAVHTFDCESRYLLKAISGRVHSAAICFDSVPH